MQIIQKQKTNLFKFKFHECLAIVQQAEPQLFSPGLKVTEEYGVSRSFRRGGTSEAMNNGAPPEVIELNGRWRKSYQSGASRPNVTIREHYVDVPLALNPLLAFSKFL